MVFWPRNGDLRCGQKKRHISGTPHWVSRKLHLNGVKVYFYDITNGESHCRVLPARPTIGGCNCWFGDPCERIVEVMFESAAPTTWPKRAPL